jgi:hypothetical protein
MPSPDAGDDFPGSQVDIESRLFFDVGDETVADGTRPEVTMGAGNNKNRVQVNLHRGDRKHELYRRED